MSSVSVTLCSSSEKAFEDRLLLAICIGACPAALIAADNDNDRRCEDLDFDRDRDRDWDADFGKGIPERAASFSASSCSDMMG